MIGHALKLICATSLLVGLPVRAADLVQVRPEEVGLSSQRLARIGEVLTAETRRAVASTISVELLNRDGSDPVEGAARILMNRYGIDKIAAYSLLVRLAKGSGHTVAAAARRLIEKGASVDPT